MRAYFFGNMYLSSIQQGIQAQHCTAEMFIKYLNPPKPGWTRDKLFDWAKNHKTTVLLNGGDSSEIYAIRHHFEQEENPYPFAMFEESVDALCGATTCTGIILPGRIYDAASNIREGFMIMTDPLSHWELKMCDILNTCRMAR